ncbi:MAG: aminoacetone oxidase family FAD-binding enzyme, partial [Sedimentisphaerales bacterium]|nr:aminoacetone oxidase family FAD-binding enzyme [Sedimentisphaerales bacterium]
FHARSVILATGGVSWPETGSTGDGYAIAASFGHTIVKPQAALIPLVTKEPWVSDLQGLGLEQVQIKAFITGIKISSSIGAMMFTQDGIGGPVVFDLSRHLTGWCDSKTPIELRIDFFPGMDRKPLEQKLIALCNAHPKKKMPGLLCELMPRALCETLCRLTDCSDVSASQLPKDKRNSLLDLCKALPLHVVSTRPIEEATVTRGGVDTAQIDPETMQSRLCPGLYFAGEVINVDGPCGGYNLQIAFSTGYLAGQSVTSYPPDEESLK